MRPLRSLGLAAAAMLAAASVSAAETVADRVFGAEPFADVPAPSHLRYRYEMRGQGIDPPFASSIALEVREADGEGSREVFVDMFEGVNRRAFGPIAAREQNPLVLVFLQRDVTQMANLTGGAPEYFRQQLRRAFNEPAESEAIEIALGGRTLPARRLVMTPFADDPRIDRFPQFRDKTYEFVVAEDVPGGIYRVGSRTPDPRDGHLILEETVTFESAGP